MNATCTETPSLFDTNRQAALALGYIQQTGESIFLTGKAGTGKTTLLSTLLEQPPKRLIVTAPTGVAAINAGGVTLHSFFQLPRSPFIPGHELHGQLGPLRFSREKLAIIKSLELLIIDEISMVRADTVDRIDAILRQLRRSELPFGGIQLLMIGDLHQLSPVVKNDEQALLQTLYPTPYFFQARAFHSHRFLTITLEHIYRQSDPQFISLLNQVRDNCVSPKALAHLNSRYQEHTQQSKEQAAITLTTHNKTAQEINQNALDQLSGKAKHFTAHIENDYPPHAFPAPEQLTLKVGAQVMFVRNDTSGKDLYFNGKIGRVTKMDTKSVTVRTLDDDLSIQVEPQIWENLSYTLDTETQEIKTQVEGTYAQLPLQLAWAVTIHKSQGLTFEKVVIDAQAAFAAGQVYVALSRCRSLEGITLASRINQRAIRTDAHIKAFTDQAYAQAPTEAELKHAQKAYQQRLIHELFDFGSLKSRWMRLSSLLQQHEKNLVLKQSEPLAELLAECDTHLFSVADKFHRQLERLFSQTQLPQIDPQIQERITKAIAYFTPYIERLEQWRSAFAFDTDNKETRQSLNRVEERLRQLLNEQLLCLEACQHGFDVTKLLKARVTAAVGQGSNSPSRSSTTKNRKEPSYAFGASELKHPELYEALKQWREKEARHQGVSTTKLIAQHLLIQVAALMPVTKKELSAIHGLGQRVVKDCGQGLIDTVKHYCKAKNLTPEQARTPAPDTPQPDSQTLTLNLYTQKHMGVNELCNERGLTVGTIKRHLADGVEQGKITLEGLLSPEEIELIERAIHQHETEGGSRAVFAAITNDPAGKGLDYNDIRLVQAHLKVQKKAQADEQSA